MPKENAAYWINKLALQPHPEGGFYKEVFRSTTLINRAATGELRTACTSIYYLSEGNDYSGFHRIASDEMWYFHKGAPLHIHVIDEDGKHQVLELSDLETGTLSLVVKAGLWFAAEVPGKIGFTLVSCAVAPGFEFSEFDMANKEELIIAYSQHFTVFNRLCRF